MRNVFYFTFFVIFSFACNTGKNAFDPNKKYPPKQLQQDYTIFRNILQDSHPSLYWYTTKDSLDHYFDNGYASIKDSMTLPQFRTLLSYTISKINCGHTSVRYSKKYIKYLDTAKQKLFPLSLKIWPDTMAVTVNLNRKDSILKRGVIITKINGLTAQQLTDSLFNYVVRDGYNLTGKYQTLSNDFVFGSWYKNIFGLKDTLDIFYLDNAGEEKEIFTPLYDPKADTIKRKMPSVVQELKRSPKPKPIRKLMFYRSLEIDTVYSTAFMTINTFAAGYHLKKFFRSSFKTLTEKNIKNLVIDLRSNGGGETTNSTFLTRFIIDKKFKLADSLYAISRHSEYDRYISKSFLYRIFMLFATRKREDGKYHYGYFERHYYQPRSEDHYNGHVYVLIGGNSFSAATLFAGAIKGQKNVTLIGEETGGGNYGNTAWIIPDVTLPNTKMRFRLPKFRLVINKDEVKNGRGIMPDVIVVPTTEAIRRGIDFKAAKAKELIEERPAQNP